MPAPSFRLERVHMYRRAEESDFNVGWAINRQGLLFVDHAVSFRMSRQTNSRAKAVSSCSQSIFFYKHVIASYARGHLTGYSEILLGTL